MVFPLFPICSGDPQGRWGEHFQVPKPETTVFPPHLCPRTRAFDRGLRAAGGTKFLLSFRLLRAGKSTILSRIPIIRAYLASRRAPAAFIADKKRQFAVTRIVAPARARREPPAPSPPRPHRIRTQNPCSASRVGVYCGFDGHSLRQLVFILSLLVLELRSNSVEWRWSEPKSNRRKASPLPASGLFHLRGGREP